MAALFPTLTGLLPKILGRSLDTHTGDNQAVSRKMLKQTSSLIKEQRQIIFDTVRRDALF